MKLRFALYLVIVAVGLVIFFLIYNPKVFNPTWAPWHCSSYSGRYSAVGDATKACIRSGCVVGEKTFIRDPEGNFDADMVEFECVKP